MGILIYLFNNLKSAVRQFDLLYEWLHFSSLYLLLLFILGNNFKFADVPITDFPDNHHPVFLEIGYEQDCGPINLKPFWMNFEEFKYDIPYVIAEDVGPLTYKSVIYLPTVVLSESARLTYNLNASKADHIEMTETSYDIRKGGEPDGLKFHAEFQADGDWETGNGPRFAVFEDIVSQTWFGRLEEHVKSCGNNKYDLGEVRYRSVVGTIDADEGIVSPMFPSDTVKVASLNQVSYGAAEVYVNFTITSAFDCLP